MICWCSILSGHQDIASHCVALLPVLVSLANIYSTGRIHGQLSTDPVGTRLPSVRIQLLGVTYPGNVAQFCEPNRVLLH